MLGEARVLLGEAQAAASTRFQGTPRSEKAKPGVQCGEERQASTRATLGAPPETCLRG